MSEGPLQRGTGWLWAGSRLGEMGGFMATVRGPLERREGFLWWCAVLSMGIPAGHCLLAMLGLQMLGG